MATFDHEGVTQNQRPHAISHDCYRVSSFHKLMALRSVQLSPSSLSRLETCSPSQENHGYPPSGYHLLTTVVTIKINYIAWSKNAPSENISSRESPHSRTTHTSQFPAGLTVKKQENRATPQSRSPQKYSACPPAFPQYPNCTQITAGLSMGPFSPRLFANKQKQLLFCFVLTTGKCFFCPVQPHPTPHPPPLPQALQSLSPQVFLWAWSDTISQGNLWSCPFCWLGSKQGSNGSPGGGHS